MKKMILFIIPCLFLSVLNCNEQGIFGEELNEDLHSRDLKVSITESKTTNSDDSGEHCKTVNLIAGQHHIAGVVTVDVVDGYLVITYEANADWTIDATHLHVTSCEEDGFPLNGADNPKIGRFEYSETHGDGTKTVIYSIPLSEVTEDYCFAAHAEVSGPSEETAWAEGSDFGGNSWAMFVEATLSECEDDDDGGGGAF